MTCSYKIPNYTLELSADLDESLEPMASGEVVFDQITTHPLKKHRESGRSSLTLRHKSTFINITSYEI